MDALRVEDLRKSFGGLMVLSGLSFAIQPGQKIALIGPNGAGKTTLINILTGLIPVDNGRIWLFDRDISLMPPHFRASCGLARSFQINTLLSNLTVLTNILLAVQGTQTVRYRMIKRITTYTENIDRARTLLEIVDLWKYRDYPVLNLGHGQKRQLEIIMALASNPRLLLLDEPTAGLTGEESGKLVETIRSVVGDAAVLFCAHDMDLVFKLAGRVIVLYSGQLIADGPPEVVAADSKVTEIYLGSEETEDA
jgi:branched-chain amino acid transport system ATP-binding protein